MKDYKKCPDCSGTGNKSLLGEYLRCNRAPSPEIDLSKYDFVVDIPGVDVEKEIETFNDSEENCIRTTTLIDSEGRFNVKLCSENVIEYLTVPKKALDISTVEVPKGWHRHPNGGGLVQDTAYADQSAYVARDAKVEEFAIVTVAFSEYLNDGQLSVVDLGIADLLCPRNR